MHWVYLSPHFDDAIYSCGAAIWLQGQSGERVEIWTICAGEPPPQHPLTPFASQLHARWGLSGQGVEARRAEDAAACARVGAMARPFAIPDCIYRYDPSSGQPMVQDEQGLWASANHPEPWLVDQLADQLGRQLPGTAQVAAPLAIGSHTDHWLVRLAAQKLGLRLWYYPDVPYVMRNPPGWEGYSSASSITPERLSAAAIEIWQQAAADYASQLTTFWPNRAALDAAFELYARQGGGRLLQLP